MEYTVAHRTDSNNDRKARYFLQNPLHQKTPVPT